MHAAHDLTRFPTWGVYGHDWAIDFLEKGLHHGRTRHAYLFLGTSARPAWRCPSP